MSKWQWWPDFEQVCAPNMTGPKKASEPQDAGENDNSLQLCSLAVCLLAAASTQTTPAIVQSPVLAREQTSATLCFKSNQNTIDIYSHISNT